MVSSSTIFRAGTKSRSLPGAATATVRFVVVGVIFGGGAIVIWVSSFRGATTMNPLPPLPPRSRPPVSSFRGAATITPLPHLSHQPRPLATRPLPLPIPLPLPVTATIVCAVILLRGRETQIITNHLLGAC